MARKVYITSEMSIDERLLNVSDENPLAAILWPWILTSFDDWGRSEAKSRKLKAKIFPGNEIVTSELIDISLQLYDKNGLLELYEVDNRPYMAIPPKKWFKYQTQIRKIKREVDESKYPSPLLARECAQTRGDSSKNIPSPSTLPPFHPSPSIDTTTTTRKNEKMSNGVLDYVDSTWGRGLSPRDSEIIVLAMNDLIVHGSAEPTELMCEAINRCNDSNVRTAKYLDSIIRRWLDNGLLTMEKVKQDDNRHKQAKGGREREPNRAGNRKYEDTEPKEPPRKYPISNFAENDPDPEF